MWVIENGRGPETCWGNRLDREQQDQNNHPTRLLARPRRPVNTVTWQHGSCSALHQDRAPCYLSFVSKAILWDRGLYHYTDHTVRDGHPSLCPRFLVHMKTCPADLRPPTFLSSNPRPRPPRQEPTQQRQALSGLKTHSCADSRSRSLQYCSTTRGRRLAVVVPCVPVPVSPPPSRASPSRASPELPVCPSPTSSTDSGQQGTGSNPVPASALPHVHTQKGEKETEDGVKEMGGGTSASSGAFRPPRPDQDPNSGPEDIDPSVSPIPSVCEDSLSDFSRPPSSQFSRSTDLGSGRSSPLCANLSDLDSEGGSPLSQHGSSSMSLSALASCTPQDPPTHQPPNPAPHHPLHHPLPHQAQHCPPDWTTTEPQPGHVPPPYPDPDPFLEPNPDPTTLAFPSDTWQACPSPQCRITPRPGLGSGLTSSPVVVERQDWTSHRWSVLPPISPVRDGSDTVSSWSRCSQVSSSQSHVFDELEAIAPRTGSCLSLDHPLSPADCSPPGTEMSPGLAALTVGCDSGDLGSLSRVQLLLLDRSDPVEPHWLAGQDKYSPTEDRTTDLTAELRARRPLSPRLYTTGVLQPLTAGSCGDGSVSERCVATGKVQEQGEHTMQSHTEDGSRSPSSWISDSSPSGIISGSTSSQCESCCGPSPDQGVPVKEEPGCPDRGERGWASTVGRRRPGRLERRMREKERKREERKTKVLNIYSRLQDSGPLQPSRNRGRSKFEDFDFLAKYCIFSQEKLAEYKRAFEAVDSDADGYISCLQVLLALKKIIPPELLSDEEEIYVYRILEMVDFRVTDGLTDLRLFAVIASLAQKIATMDVFMRSLISKMDFHSLSLKLYKAKQLFMFLLEGQTGGAVAQQGCISAEQLLVELKAGGIRPEQEEAIKQELRHISSLDLLDFLAYLPLFVLIHNSVIANPLDDSSNL
ncbi:flocculation protein FLO11 isoform X3 [Salmo trutta]|uniref:flocculation protein FLO11 isoform X3 n=1 Tax=Salmo trutta TaxID=8032 RepID=UPI001130E0CE|nr:flocculation protein FLO11-like isoform X3 [Salmo trutta]